MIKVENLSKSFGSLKVLENVNVEIKKGECVAIIGPSGTGKSVFLYCLNGLEKNDGGNIYINGTNISDKNTDINKIREKMGMVYQNFNLFSHLTVLENIILAPVKIRKIPRDKAIERALKLLEMVCLVDKKNSYPDELSGGQKQRIAIVRAMAMDPEVVLFDEPTSALDPTMVGEVLAVIRNFAKLGFTMLIVTHEMNFAKEVASRILFMDERGIYESGSPDEIFNNPKKERTKAFIRKLKTFNYNVNSYNFDLIEMNSQLELFCFKYAIERKKNDYANLVLEEMITHILKYCYDGKRPPNIDITVEYGDIDKKIEIEIIHDGKTINPFEKISFEAAGKDGEALNANGGDGDDDDMGIFIVSNIATDVNFKSENGLNKYKIKI
ncbi:MAG TPA: amino acid ABC transporter ATP-binding protein [Candidatus Wallbacteria bacterium]|nr:MAG: Arginine transport ATP-binding protein ArtM [bacterium ADurb.Bin243]HPG56412.1 amino acid ABC transporter ATP-binding protein [Candidatus Wallbacteria bacterium]